ncbi:hypothetical protein RRF57_004649 [Xylaria bambusicola]|uniref:Uncharacterized protein n=1 Tax=Xylaria bambusicola TaxID=326684 RepID=A0AAN7UNH7_9PEZI
MSALQYPGFQTTASKEVPKMKFPNAIAIIQTEKTPDQNQTRYTCLSQFHEYGPVFHAPARRAAQAHRARI